MTIGIHQPNFAPWLGYFDKIAKSDVFVIIDHVQYVKGSVANRNKIKNANGDAIWLTVPVRKYKHEQPYNETEISYDSNWKPKFFNLIKSSYAKAPGFQRICPMIEEVLEPNPKHISDLNIDIIRKCCKLLNIQTEIHISSQLGLDLGGKNDLNLGLAKHFKADCYLSGKGASKYNDADLFESAGVDLKYQEYEHPVYEQLNGSFVPNLSIIDMLMNCGSNSNTCFTENI